jgi:hypothetical protein
MPSSSFFSAKKAVQSGMRNHEWGLSYNDVHLRPEGRRLSSSASIDSLATMEATALAHATSSRFILLSSPMSTGTSTDVCRDDEASSPRPLRTTSNCGNHRFILQSTSALSSGPRGGDRAARRWRSPRVSGARSPVEEPTHRWSRAPVEELARWCLDGWLQEGVDGGGAEP